MKTMTQGKIVLIACGSFSPPTYMHLRMFEIAKDYIHSLGLGTVVGGIVSPVHDAYGKKDLVAAQHRIAMLKLALRSSQWIKVSEWETQQAGWTRTRVSLQYHQDTINTHLRNHELDNADPPSWLPDDILNNSVTPTRDTTDGTINRDEPEWIINRDEPDRGLNRPDHNITVKLLCGADLLESFATPGLWSDDDMETIVGRHGLVVVTRAGNDPGRFIYDSDMLHRYRKNISLVTNYIANEVSSTVIRRLMRRGESAKYLTDDAVLSYIRQNKLYGSDSKQNLTEYGIIQDIIANYGKKSPQDITMASPEEKSFKNILISIRDRPQNNEFQIQTKRSRKSNILNSNSHTDSVAPMNVVKNKMAYLDKVPATFVPGKAVKIVSSEIKREEDETVGLDSKETEYLSLDGFSKQADTEYDYNLYRRRVSADFLDHSLKTDKEKVPMKKRCSSTIRKLKPETNEMMKKSKSEVSKLCDKVKSMKLKEGFNNFNNRTPRNFKTRSCNDIVRLILTKHGIHVLSDTEAIV